MTNNKPKLPARRIIDNLRKNGERLCLLREGRKENHAKKPVRNVAVVAWLLIMDLKRNVVFVAAAV